MKAGSEKSRIEKLENENSRLRQAVDELSILNEIATAVSSALSLDNLVELIVRKCVKYLKVEQGAVMLLDRKKKAGTFHTLVRKTDQSNVMLPFRLDAQLTGWMIKHEKPLLVNDLATDPRFKISDPSSLPVKSLLSVPLRLKGEMIGVLNAFNKKKDACFSDEDQRLLAIIAAQSAQAVENARLLEEEKELIRIQQEMRLAHDIQVKLLPKTAPEVPGYKITGRSIPAKEVGGDYYDFVAIDKNRTAFCVGDISGKGMPAALLMSNLQAMLRGQTEQDVPATTCVKHCNKLLYKNTAADRFATLFFGILDAKNHRITCVNAGHNPPFVFDAAGEHRQLDPGGTILGFLEDFPFSETTLVLDPGDVLVVYSDGITEAINDKEEDFEESRLVETVRGKTKQNPNQLVDTILQSVQTFTGDTPQADDMTLVVVKRDP